MGILGRILDAIQSKNYSTGAIGIDNKFLSLEGSKRRQIDVVGKNGANEFYPGGIIDKNDMTDYFKNLLNQIKESQPYPGDLGRKLRIVSKLIQSHEKRGVNRDAFHLRLRGFDTHFNLKERLDNG